MASEQDMLLERIEDKIKATAKEVKNGMIGHEEFDNHLKEINTKLSNVTDKAMFDELKGSVEQIAKDFTSLKESQKGNITFTDDLKEAIIKLQENFKNGVRERVQVKTVGDMIQSASVGGTGAKPTMLTPMAEVKLPVPLAFQICNVFSTSEGVITDVSQTNEEGGAAGTDEGSAKNQYDFVITGAQTITSAVNAYIKITRQMLLNFGYLENFIKNRLYKKVYDKASSYAFEGTGNGSQAIWKGVNQYADAWAAGSWAATLTNPGTLWPALLIGVAQVRSKNFEPNAILINPADFVGLQLDIITKQINLPEALVSGGQMFVSGVPIYPTNHITSDKFQVGDYKYSNIAIQQPFELFVDPYSGLTTNYVTILGELTGCHYIQASDHEAFVLGDISTCATALGSNS
jgi:hypothetical protein